MEIPKDRILELLKQRGEHGKADEAERELPDQVDPRPRQRLLDRLGVDPQDLLANVGGLGDRLGL